jgi:His/Glu/Gln/Arg/opine family amino acid ABC transporter permease subunit
MGDIDWGVIWYAIPYMLQGAVVTLEISALALVVGCAVGVVGGFLLLSEIWPLKWLVRAYVYFVRGTPALVQIFLIYFALPIVGIYIPAFWGAVVALGLNAGGFIAEIVRAGLQSIDKGQTEAAKAIGMTHRQTLRHILFPQSLRVITPPLTNEVITLVKSSSLLSAISIFELTRTTQVIVSAKFAPFELYALLAVFYLVIISVLAKISEDIERRLA